MKPFSRSAAEFRAVLGQQWWQALLLSAGRLAFDYLAGKGDLVRRREAMTDPVARR